MNRASVGIGMRRRYNKGVAFLPVVVRGSVMTRPARGIVIGLATLLVLGISALGLMRALRTEPVDRPTPDLGDTFTVDVTDYTPPEGRRLAAGRRPDRGQEDDLRPHRSSTAGRSRAGR